MTEIRLDRIYVPSGDIVVRENEGELIIIPLTPGNAQEDLYTLNGTGKEIWEKLDGATTLQAVAEALAAEYEAAAEEIERDMLDLVGELCKRNILVAVSAE